jgi:hypothetical protein
MAVVFSKKEVGVTDTSVTVKVPDNDIAKLMYYLKSICSILGLETTGYNITRLTDYDNHYMLTNDEKVKLLLLCGYLSPDVLNNKCIFHSDELCGDSNNLNSTETAFVAAESVFVGSAKVSVKEIMAYKMSWMRKNYINPMTRCIKNQRAIISNTRPAIQTRTRTPPVRRNTTGNNTNWHYSSNSSSLDCCVIL